MGRRRRPGRDPDRPGVLRAQGQDQPGLRRGRGHLRRGRGQPAGAPDPHRAVQDAGDPRRGAPRRRRAVVGRRGPGGLRAGPAAAGAHRDAVPLRHQPDPVRDVRRGARRRPAQPRGLHLRLRAGAGRPRRPPGAVHGLQRRDVLAHPGRGRGRRPAGGAAHQGPHRPGAAHRARPVRGVDAVGARRRGQAAHRGTPARARRGRDGDRLRPGLRPRLRRAAEDDHRRAADRGALRREGRLQADRDLQRERGPLDGRGPDGLRGRRRAAAGRRRLRDPDRHPAVLRAGRRPVRAGPAPRGDRLGLPALGAEPARLRLRDGGRARPRAPAQGQRRRRHLRRRGGPARTRRRPPSRPAARRS